MKKKKKVGRKESVLPKESLVTEYSSLVIASLAHADASVSEGSADLEAQFLEAGESIRIALGEYTDVASSYVECGMVSPGRPPCLDVFAEWKSSEKSSDAYGYARCYFTEGKLYVSGNDTTEFMIEATPDVTDQEVVEFIYSHMSTCYDPSPGRTFQRDRVSESLFRMIRLARAGQKIPDAVWSQILIGLRTLIGERAGIIGQHVSLNLTESGAEDLYNFYFSWPNVHPITRSEPIYGGELTPNPLTPTIPDPPGSPPVLPPVDSEGQGKDGTLPDKCDDIKSITVVNRDGSPLKTQESGGGMPFPTPGDVDNLPNPVDHRKSKIRQWLAKAHHATLNKELPKSHLAKVNADQEFITQRRGKVSDATVSGSYVGYVRSPNIVIDVVEGRMWIGEREITSDDTDETVAAELVTMAHQDESTETARLIEGVVIIKDKTYRIVETVAGTLVTDVDENLLPGIVNIHNKTHEKNKWHTCKDCEFNVPKYPGRYPRYCPNCGTDMAGQDGYPHPSLKIPNPPKPAIFDVKERYIPIDERIELTNWVNETCCAMHAASGMAMIPWSPNHRMLCLESTDGMTSTFMVFAPIQECVGRCAGRLTVATAMLNNPEAFMERVNEVITKYAESAPSITALEHYTMSEYQPSSVDEVMSYAAYHGHPDKIKDRSNRNKARRKLGLKNGDPREADHKTPMSKGGGNGEGNLRAVSRHTNRTKCNKSEADEQTPTPQVTNADVAVQLHHLYKKNTSGKKVGGKKPESMGAPATPQVPTSQLSGTPSLPVGDVAIPEMGGTAIGGGMSADDNVTTTYKDEATAPLVHKDTRNFKYRKSLGKTYIFNPRLQRWVLNVSTSGKRPDVRNVRKRVRLGKTYVLNNRTGRWIAVKSKSESMGGEGGIGSDAVTPPMPGSAALSASHNMAAAPMKKEDDSGVDVDTKGATKPTSPSSAPITTNTSEGLFSNPFKKSGSTPTPTLQTAKTKAMNKYYAGRDSPSSDDWAVRAAKRDSDAAKGSSSPVVPNVPTPALTVPAPVPVSTPTPTTAPATPKVPKSPTPPSATPALTVPAPVPVSTPTPTTAPATPKVPKPPKPPKPPTPPDKDGKKKKTTTRATRGASKFAGGLVKGLGGVSNFLARHTKSARIPPVGQWMRGRFESQIQSPGDGIDVHSTLKDFNLICSAPCSESPDEDVITCPGSKPQDMTKDKKGRTILLGADEADVDVSAKKYREALRIARAIKRRRQNVREKLVPAIETYSTTFNGPSASSTPSLKKHWIVGRKHYEVPKGTEHYSMGTTHPEVSKVVGNTQLSVNKALRDGHALRAWHTDKEVGIQGAHTAQNLAFGQHYIRTHASPSHTITWDDPSGKSSYSHSYDRFMAATHPHHIFKVPTLAQQYHTIETYSTTFNGPSASSTPSLKKHWIVGRKHYEVPKGTEHYSMGTTHPEVSKVVGNTQLSVNKALRDGHALRAWHTDKEVGIQGAHTAQNLAFGQHYIRTHASPSHTITWDDPSGKSSYSHSYDRFMAATHPHHIFKVPTLAQQYHKETVDESIYKAHVIRSRQTVREKLVPAAKADVGELELSFGSAVEREHTNSPEKASEIARQHLKEDPSYYKKLFHCGVIRRDEVGDSLWTQASKTWGKKSEAVSPYRLSGYSGDQGAGPTTAPGNSFRNMGFDPNKPPLMPTPEPAPQDLHKPFAGNIGPSPQVDPNAQAQGQAQPQPGVTAPQAGQVTLKFKNTSDFKKAAGWFQSVGIQFAPDEANYVMGFTVNNPMDAEVIGRTAKAFGLNISGVA
jgi:hypothetical protein